jgi:hypothetical protein
MKNLHKNGCQIVNGQLIVKSGMQAEIPLTQILWIELGDDPYDPQVIIKTVAGITVRFCVDPQDKQPLKSLIQAEQAKTFRR